MMTRLRVSGRAVEVTSPDRVLFPEDGITKGDLVEYYRAVARYLVPHLRERPVNLERFPNGVDAAGFFQQEMPEQAPAWVDGVVVEKAGGTVRHVVVKDAATLVYLANLSCVTLHAWLSRRARLDFPDQMIFDLDPPGEVPGRVREAARWLGELLRELGLVPFLKTTGSSGYHVTVPLDGKADFDTVRGFARDVAEHLAGRHPDELTTEVRKRERGERIFIDTLRNAYAHTAVPPFTVRARRGAPVAAPVGWDELDDPAVHPAAFTIRNVLGRLEAGVDPWRDFRRRAKGLGTARARLKALD